MPTLKLSLAVGALVVMAVGFTAAHASAAPTVEFGTESGAILVNFPILPAEAGIQPATPITGAAADDVAVTAVHVSVTGANGSADGNADLVCGGDPDNPTSCSWSWTPEFPLVPGDYTATATATDGDGNSTSATQAVQII